MRSSVVEGETLLFFSQQLLSFTKLNFKIMITVELVDGAMNFVQRVVYRKSVEGKMVVAKVTRLLDRVTLQPVAILEEKIIPIHK